VKGDPLLDEEAQGDASEGLIEPTKEVPTLDIDILRNGGDKGVRGVPVLDEEADEGDASGGLREPTGEVPAVNL